ncbi:MAG: hypothetical protein GY750_17170 [Lentisphaerae bacterium]|nr:hypothetical protein [Lentisphaerota bacterium]MCP4103129.1 hypothetical protein [Lentisphaerota bacterium]
MALKKDESHDKLIGSSKDILLEFANNDGIRAQKWFGVKSPGCKRVLTVIRSYFYLLSKLEKINSLKRINDKLVTINATFLNGSAKIIILWDYLTKTPLIASFRIPPCVYLFKKQISVKLLL